MSSKKITVRVLKITILAIAHFIIILLISSGVSLLMANFNLGRISHNTGVNPDIVGDIGLLGSIALSSIILAFFMLKVKLEAINAVFISISLVLFNIFMLNKNINNLYEHIDSIFILVITPVTVFYIFKKYEKDTNIT